MVRVVAVVSMWAAIGCGGGKHEPVKRDPVGSDKPLVSGADTVAGPAKPDFPEGTHSLELTHTVGVRLEPADDARRIGTVAIDTRVGWTRTKSGKGCKKSWIEIEPRGWICGDYVKPSTNVPFGREVPHLDRGELVPGTYGKVTAPNSVTFILQKPEPPKKKKPGKKPKKSGPVTSPRDSEDDAPPADPTTAHMVEDKPLVGSINVRDYETVTVDGKVYWKIAQKDNEYVLASAISQHNPSRYGGARLGDDTGWPVPVAFVWVGGGAYTAWTTNKAQGGGPARQLASRTALPIFEMLRDKAEHPIAYRVADAEWIAAGSVRVFTPAPPPALLGKGERWIDVDLDNQILVAFEGDVPVYTTMVSTGGKDTPTDPGIYRMWVKESEADMKGLNGEDPYSVATVPWTQFFSPEKGLALHTAYWYDQFGIKRSHGCVNLAPRDARWLYFWSDPQVPPGWTMTAGVVEAPGSIVRVRNKETPNPEIKGYAKDVQEARERNPPPT